MVLTLLCAHTVLRFPQLVTLSCMVHSFFQMALHEKQLADTRDALDRMSDVIRIIRRMNDVIRRKRADIEVCDMRLLPSFFIAS